MAFAWPGARQLPGFLGVGGDGSSISHTFRLSEEEFAGGRSTTSYWGVDKPLDLRVGQSATLCQFGSVDGRSGRSSERDLGFDRDPLAVFREQRPNRRWIARVPGVEQLLI